MPETIVIIRTLNLGIINALLKGTNNQLKANCESQSIFLAGKKEIPFLCNQMTIMFLDEDTVYQNNKKCHGETGTSITKKLSHGTPL